MAAPCSSLLHGNLVREGNSSKVLPLQPIPAHSYMARLFREGNSSKDLPLQPIADHFFMVFLVREVILQKPPLAALCSSLLHGNFSQGGNSSKVLPLQTIVAH